MAGENLRDIWRDPAEAVGELLLEKGLDKSSPALAHVPLLSVAIAAYKSAGAISDYLLARKVQQFYTAWEKLPEPERRSVYQKFQKKQRPFIEKLLLILEQQDDVQKCQLLGVITTHYLRGTLRRDQYYDLIETVSRLSASDLVRFAALSGKGLILAEKEVTERYAVLYITRGLIATELPLPDEQRSEDSRTFYRLTAQGSKLLGALKDVSA